MQSLETAGFLHPKLKMPLAHAPLARVLHWAHMAAIGSFCRFCGKNYVDLVLCSRLPTGMAKGIISSLVSCQTFGVGPLGGCGCELAKGARCRAASAVGRLGTAAGNDAAAQAPAAPGSATRR
jgi:hypothetical protein